ncbi:MAG: hypothetical protein ACTHQM_24545 [Thermoanaerobaculia bacterium]
MKSAQSRFSYTVEREVPDHTTRDSRILRSHEWRDLNVALELYRRAKGRCLPGKLRLIKHDNALNRRTVLCSAMDALSTADE